jgi:hypothetical protein
MFRHEHRTSKDYVDVRGLWPCYINGQCGRELVGAPRYLTVEQARDWKPSDVKWTDTDFPRDVVHAKEE